MRLFGVTMVRNEADVIEAFVRHNLVVGHLAYLLTRPSDRGLARHWRDLYAELMAGAIFDETRLREAACSYGASRKKRRPLAEVELVEDPVQLAVELRYGEHAASDPLRSLAWFAETLIAAQGSTTA